MRAVVVERFDAKLSVQEVDLRPLEARQVRVRLGASGVCHSDLSQARGQYPFALPRIAGHEGAGTVVETGPDVRRVAVGDRVVASFVPSCGECWQCARARSYLCEAATGLPPFSRGSIAGVDLPPQTSLGTMADVMTVYDDYLVRVETDLPDEQLALLGCGVTTGVGAALWTARVTPGSSVAIFGAGGVGIAAVQGARIAGATRIVVVDPGPKREAAFAFGATDYVDPTDGDPVHQIRDLTQGRGVDYSIEVVGKASVMRQAYDAACRGGTVVYVGLLPPDMLLELPANELHRDGKTIVGCANGSARVRTDFPTLIALVESGRLDVGGMVSRRLPLDGVNDAFEAMARGEVVRSVLIP